MYVREEDKRLLAVAVYLEIENQVTSFCLYFYERFLSRREHCWVDAWLAIGAETIKKGDKT